MRVKLTRPVIAVAVVLMNAEQGDQMWGLRICEETRLSSGTVYPLLERLEKAEIITRWAETPAPEGRDRRMLYAITARGRDAVTIALSRARRWAEVS